MPTLWTDGPYRFFIVMRDCDEPPHVHVSGGSGHAKLWLGPPPRLAASRGYTDHERRRLEHVVERRLHVLRARWDEECARAGR